MSTNISVLVVEDSDDDCELLLRELKKGGFDPVWRRVETSDSLAEALEQRSWDVIFADYTMPGFSGTRALSMVRGSGSDAPFIFVSGTIGEDIAVAAMRAGAQDYIMKNNLRRLIPALERELRECGARRKHARVEAKRRAAERRYRNILTIAADAVITIDEAQCITLFNQGAERMFDYRAEDIMGRPLEVLIAPRFGALLRRHIEEFGRSREPARYLYDQDQIFGVRHGGAEFPVEASLSKLVEDGRTAYTVILRDITQRKRAEEEVHLLRDVTVAAANADNVDDALQGALQKICEHAGWTFAQAWLPDLTGRSLLCHAVYHRPADELRAFHAANRNLRLAKGAGLPGRVWDTGEPIWLPDVAREPGLLRVPSARRARLCAVLAAPVIAENKVAGVLEFFAREQRAADPRLMRIIAAVGAHLGTVLQRKRTEERLHHLAHYDPLTNLPNRLLFADRLRQAILEAKRSEQLVGVIFLDVDRFKTINDSLGHGVGDQLLQAIAQRLSACIRACDTVARLAGDEFTFVLTNLSHVQDIERVARSLLDSFSQPFEVAGTELYSSASIGITICPLDDSSVDGLLKNADIAMYRAKERGGSSYEYYAAHMTRRARTRLALENALRRALDREQFELFYQPVVAQPDGAVTGVEVLLRWRHPERGLVAPDEFISVAEETGLIVPIGEWVLRNACQQYRGLGVANLRLAVNVSLRQFERGRLLQQVNRVLSETHFDPARLDLEITETLLMQDSRRVVQAMRELGAQGMHFSVDDFGTGYSSLAYLKHLPIARVKIDKSFIRDVQSDPNDAAIVNAIISMARNLGLGVVAEGVENADQLRFLRDLGCDEVQGYCFSPPLSLRRCKKFLQRAQCR